MKVIELLDKLFKENGDLQFDKMLLRKMIKINIDFITTNPDVRDMMGSKLIGCFHISYTQYHKNIFYEDILGITFDDVVEAISKITSIPKNFKVARDDINLMCFYMTHRFLNSPHLNKQERIDGATEVLNYFGYRTLITLNAHYWPYPITRADAVSVSEQLSRNYLIVKLKNWNEYVMYRSDAYLTSKFLPILKDFNKDKELPNAINDLYNRYKDVFKNIYKEFKRLEDSNRIRSKGSIVTDLEGDQVLMDRLGDPKMYTDKVKTALTSPDSFIRPNIVEIAVTIGSSIGNDQLVECLKLMLEYNYTSPNTNKEVSKFVEDFLSDSIDYLQNNKVYINNSTSVVEIVNLIAGNLLYSRGADISITEVKKRGEILIEKVYKKGHTYISKRNLSGVRNVYCIYILILALI